VIPLVEKAGVVGNYLVGHHTEVDTQDELAKLKKTIEMMGYYWVHQNRDEFNEYKSDPKKVDALFKHLMMERLKE